jgi:hypothetical protein
MWQHSWSGRRLARPLPRAGALAVSACLLAAAATLASAATATAAGKPVNVGTPYESGPPAVAVDAAGDAVIAWANTKDLAGASNFVQWCVLPVGASACSHSGSLMPADGAQYIDGVSVLDEGSSIVILADVYGTAGMMATDYEPEQEWASTDGGATFSLVDGGLSVTDGIVDADTGPINAVTVPGTGVLGFGWDTAAGVPTFNAFPLASPPECSRATCSTGFAQLEPNTNPDTLGNEPGAFAAEQGASPGVMGVFDTLFTSGPLGCKQSFGTAFVYGSGNQSASNDYNISPGDPDSAWRVPLSQVDCDVEYSTVAGGPSGFGVLEDNLGTSTVQYHAFDAATSKFDAAPVTVNGGGGELYPGLSQDGAGGIYATYLLRGDGGPLTLSYSANGGKAFASGALDPDSDGGISSARSSVNAAGQGWAAWTDNGSVLAQSFQAADAISPPSVASGASTDGTTVSLSVGCASFPCTVTIVLTAAETVVVHASSAGATAARKKLKIVTLGRGKFRLNAKGSGKLSLKLSHAGRRFFAGRKGHVKIFAAITENEQGESKLFNRRMNLAIRPRSKHAHR